MPSREEILHSLTGAWRLFLDKPDALRFFDVSVDGFWRSFGAVWLIAPAYALASLAERYTLLTDSIPDESFSDGAFVLAKGVTLGLDWVTFPILLALVAGTLGVGRSYPTYIVARNWGAVLATVPFAAISLLVLVGLAGSDLSMILSLAAIIVVLRYNYLIARNALGATIGLAIGLVVADFIVSLVIAAGIDSAFGI